MSPNAHRFIFATVPGVFTHLFGIQIFILTLWIPSETTLKYCHKAAKLPQDDLLEFKHTCCIGASSRLCRRCWRKLPNKIEFNGQKYVKISPRIVHFISTGETFSLPFLLNSIYIYFRSTLQSHLAPNHDDFYQVLDKLIVTSLKHIARALP